MDRATGGSWAGLQGGQLGRATGGPAGQGYRGDSWTGLQGGQLCRATGGTAGQGYRGGS